MTARHHQKVTLPVPNLKRPGPSIFYSILAVFSDTTKLHPHVPEWEIFCEVFTIFVELSSGTQSESGLAGKEKDKSDTEGSMWDYLVECSLGQSHLKSIILHSLKVCIVEAFVLKYFRYLILSMPLYHN